MVLLYPRISPVKEVCFPIQSLPQHSRDTKFIEHGTTTLDLLLDVALLKFCLIH